MVTFPVPCRESLRYIQARCYKSDTKTWNCFVGITSNIPAYFFVCIHTWHKFSILFIQISKHISEWLVDFATFRHKDNFFSQCDKIAVSLVHSEVNGIVIINIPRANYNASYVDGLLFVNEMRSMVFEFTSMSSHPGPRFNIKMISYQYRKSHCGIKTVLRPSYIGKMTFYIESGPSAPESLWCYT